MDAIFTVGPRSSLCGIQFESAERNETVRLSVEGSLSQERKIGDTIGSSRGGLLPKLCPSFEGCTTDYGCVQQKMRTVSNVEFRSTSDHELLYYWREIDKVIVWSVFNSAFTDILWLVSSGLRRLGQAHVRASRILLKWVFSMLKYNSTCVWCTTVYCEYWYS